MSRRRGVIAGLGVMGGHHARLLSLSDEMELLGILDPFIKADEYKGVPILRQMDQVLELQPEFAIISSPTEFHHQIGLEMIEAGLNVLIEKPLASTHNESLELLGASRSRGIVGAVGHIERFNPAIIRMKELISSGFLGDLYQISTMRTGPFPSRISDVGVAKDLASHDVDLAMWLSHSSYKDISAETFTTRGRSHEDFFVASGTLENGAVVNHSVNWMSPIKERETRATGANGMLIADTLRSELYFHEAGDVSSSWEQSAFQRGPIEGNSTRFALARTEPILAEHQAFLRLLGGEPSSVATLEDGCRVLEVLERALGL